MSHPDLIVLHGRTSTLVLEADGNGAPLWRYWGPRLSQQPLSDGSLRYLRTIPSFAPDTDTPFPVFPTFGLGWFGQSALLADREGLDFAQAFTACRLTHDEANGIRIELEDGIAGVALIITLVLNPDDDVISVRTSLTNRGAGPLRVQWLAAVTLPLPPDARNIRYFSGRHNHEFIQREEALGRGQWRRENRRGLTSHDCFPGAVITVDGTTADSGTAYGAQLAWSGNHTQIIEWLDDGRWQWQLGEWSAPGEIQLQTDQSLTTPEVLATCSSGGLNGVAQNFHAAIRRRVQWPGGAMRPRPVHLNTWEGFYFKHDVTALKSLVDPAAALGVERFVLDDGWFHNRDDDRGGLGDWWPDTRKYPEGLAPLAQYVLAKGMEFGLWVEPEMVNPHSDLFRRHPGWVLQLAGRAPLTARNQLVLDMSRSEVRDYLFHHLSELLRTLPISYLKWDHNRDLAPAADAQGRASYHRQTLGAYALLQRLREAHPQVEIEACAGGGGRIDAGIVEYTHRFWTSDTLDAAMRLEIQRGYLQFLPPELMGSHVGASPAHSTGRSNSLDFRAAVALPGHFGIELDVRKLEDADRARLGSWVKLYKSLRSHLHRRCWQGQAGDAVLWQAHGEATECFLLVYRVAPTEQRYAPSARLPFVLPTARYQITRVGLDDESPSQGSCTQADGTWLREVGFMLPILLPGSAAIFRITELNQ